MDSLQYLLDTVKDYAYEAGDKLEDAGRYIYNSLPSTTQLQKIADKIPTYQQARKQSAILGTLDTVFAKPFRMLNNYSNQAQKLAQNGNLVSKGLQSFGSGQFIQGIKQVVKGTIGSTGNAANLATTGLASTAASFVPLAGTILLTGMGAKLANNLKRARGSDQYAGWQLTKQIAQQADNQQQQQQQFNPTLANNIQQSMRNLTSKSIQPMQNSFKSLPIKNLKEMDKNEKEPNQQTNMKENNLSKIQSYINNKKKPVVIEQQFVDIPLPENQQFVDIPQQENDQQKQQFTDIPYKAVKNKKIKRSNKMTPRRSNLNRMRNFVNKTKNRNIQTQKQPQKIAMDLEIAQTPIPLGKMAIKRINNSQKIHTAGFNQQQIPDEKKYGMFLNVQNKHLPNQRQIASVGFKQRN